MSAVVHTPVRQEQAEVHAADGFEHAVAHTVHMALRPLLGLAAAHELATLWPWVVDTCWSRVEGVVQRTIAVVQAPMSRPPQAEDHIPPGAWLLRADIFPATRFDDMSPRVRGNYSTHYRALLLWRRAWALRKDVANLVEGVDYSAGQVGDNVQRWLTPGAGY